MIKESEELQRRVKELAAKAIDENGEIEDQDTFHYILGNYFPCVTNGVNTEDDMFDILGMGIRLGLKLASARAISPNPDIGWWFVSHPSDDTGVLIFAESEDEVIELIKEESAYKFKE